MGQGGGEAAAGAVQAHRGGLGADAQHGTRLIRRETVPGGQRDDLAVSRREARERSAQPREVASVGRVRRDGGRLAGEARERRGPPAHAPSVVRDLVARDRKQPRAGVAGHVVETAPGDQEHLRGDVPRLLGRAAHAIGHDGAVVLAPEGVEALLRLLGRSGHRSVSLRRAAAITAEIRRRSQSSSFGEALLEGAD